MKTLKQAKVGETVKVVKLTGQGAVKRRIMDMGITKGVEIFIRYQSGNFRFQGVHSLTGKQFQL